MPLRSLFVRLLPWASSLGFLTCVYLQAVGAVSLFTAFVLPPLPHDSGPREGAVLPSTAPPTTEALFVHNPFDWRVDLDPLVSPELQPPKEPTADRERVNPLLAESCVDIAASIITESADPTWSVSVLHTPSERAALARRVGDPVGDYEVAYIGFNHFKASPAVWLVNEQDLCQVLLFGPNAASAEPVPQSSAASDPIHAPVRRKPGTPKGALPPELALGILRISETHVAVERAVVDQILADPAAFMGAARLMPAEGDAARTTTIRLTGIREGTLLHALNLTNGDVLSRINGYDLGSPEQALNAYARLRSAQELTLDVVRHGKPVSLQVTIR